MPPLLFPDLRASSVALCWLLAGWAGTREHPGGGHTHFLKPSLISLYFLHFNHLVLKACGAATGTPSGPILAPAAALEPWLQCLGRLQPF